MENSNLFQHVSLQDLESVIIIVPVDQLRPNSWDNQLSEARRIFQHTFPERVKKTLVPSRGQKEYSFVFISR